VRATALVVDGNLDPGIVFGGISTMTNTLLIRVFAQATQYVVLYT
jgi:hypothetical protein